MTSDATSFFPAALGGIQTESRAEIGAASFSRPNVESQLSDARPSLHGETFTEGLDTTIIASDECLLGDISEGNKAALAVFFHRYARLVHSIAFRILRNDSEADDVLQEVFLYIFRKAALFDPSKGSARSWIVQLTYHRAIDRRRHLNSRHFYDALALDAPDAMQMGREVAFYERSLEGQLGKDALKSIEDALSADQRETIRLYFFEGCTIEEAAREMGQPPGNVYNHYYRALEKMRKLLFAQKLSAE